MPPSARVCADPSPFESSAASSSPIAFLLPQGLTVTGVNTWAVTVVRSLIRQGHSAIAVVHGSCDGHSEIRFDTADGVLRLDLPEARSVRTASHVAEWGKAYLSAIEEHLPTSHQHPALLLPTRHDACFAGAAWAAAHAPDRARMLLWQQLDSRYEDALLTHFEPIASALVGASATLARGLTRRYPHRSADVHHIPNAVEQPQSPSIRTPIHDRPLQLVYTGRLDEEQKRISALVHLSDELEARGVSHELRICGDGPSAEQLRLMTTNRRSISLLGALDLDDVFRELKYADFFVLASRNEGLSFSALEAMAHGCAVVLTRTRSGSDEAIEHGVSGWIVEAPDDPQSTGIALAHGVIAALQHGAHQLGRCAVERVAKHYSLARHTKLIRNLSKKLAATPPRPWPEDRSWLARSATADDTKAKERIAQLLQSSTTRRFVVHGAGTHSHRMASILSTHKNRILAITDDDHTLWGTTFLAWQIINPRDAAAQGATDVILSSDLHEDAIWARRGIYEQQGLRVHRLYAHAEDTETIAGTH